MNVAIVFAGGVGNRFSNKGIPKQFVELYGKPIIVYTLIEVSKNELIDEIVIPCVSGWESHLKELIEKFKIEKKCHIIKGGASSFSSRLNAIKYIKELGFAVDIVMLHDAVRPLVTQKCINEIIERAKTSGSAVAFVKTIETPACSTSENHFQNIYSRSSHITLKAPQAFRFDILYEAHIEAKDLDDDYLVDTCSLMSYFGFKPSLVESEFSNIKITTADDYFLFKALLDAKQYKEVFGI